MTDWMAHASIHRVQRVDPQEMTRLRRMLGARPGVAVSPAPGGVSVRLPVTAAHLPDAYAAALTILATEILPGLEPAHLTDLHITALRPR